MTSTMTPGPATAPERQDRPSAVTPAQLQHAGARRLQRWARVKLRVGAVCTLLVVVPVALAGVLPLPGPNDQDLGARLLPPLSEGHLLGTDQLGRDLLSRVLHGGQTSLMIGVLAIIVSGLIGIALGAAAGFFGGWIDAVVSRLLEAQLSLPLLLMLLLVVALFGPSIPVITFVIAIAQWPEVARLTRSLVLVERGKPYVAAAQVLGLHRLSILTRHVIPNVVRQATLVVLLLLAQSCWLRTPWSTSGTARTGRSASGARLSASARTYFPTHWGLGRRPGRS